MVPRVFVVQPIMEEGLRVLEDCADVEVFESERMISRDELMAGVARAEYVLLLGDVPIDAAVMDASPGLRGIAAMSMFPNVVDVNAATERNILVTVIDHFITKTTCDLTMALILGLAWRIVEADRFTRCRRFRQEQSMSFLTTELDGKTLGLIGLGGIGRHVARRARAFDMNVIYTKRNRLDVATERELGVEWVEERDDVLRRSDFVSIMANYNPTTHEFIGAREFGLMKPTAYFINSARGRMVDEDALVQALREHQIAGAGLDVYWHEPPVSEPAPHPDLYGFDNVILTPHIGSATREARAKMAISAARNVEAMINGERPPNLFNPEVLGEEPLPKSDRIG